MATAPAPRESSSSDVARELITRFGASPEVKRIAEQCVRFLEMAEQARAQVVSDGAVVVTKKGIFVHPMVETERRMRSSFLTAVRLLETPRRSREGRPTNTEALESQSRTVRYLKHGRSA